MEYGVVWRLAGIRAAEQMMRYVRGRADEIDAWPPAIPADRGMVQAQPIYQYLSKARAGVPSGADRCGVARAERAHPRHTA
eukprot:11179162-Lingulodinium_polyedra.AAC.1